MFLGFSIIGVQLQNLRERIKGGSRISLLPGCKPVQHVHLWLFAILLEYQSCFLSSSIGPVETDPTPALGVVIFQLIRFVEGGTPTLHFPCVPMSHRRKAAIAAGVQRVAFFPKIETVAVEFSQIVDHVLIVFECLT